MKCYAGKMILVMCFLCVCFFGIARDTFGTFRDWDYGPRGAFGFGKLEKPAHRHYCKISAIDSNSVKIEEINANEVAVRTVVVTLANGLLSQVTNTNQWGYTYEIMDFTALGNDEFMVTVMSEGKSKLLPCKAMKYTYKNDLLVVVRFISFEGKTVNATNGVAIINYKRFDDEKRFSLIKEQTFYDEDANAIVNRAWDCHKMVYERDSLGKKISEELFGEEGQRVTSRNGVFKTTIAYDSLENEIERSFFDLNGQAVANAYGVARIANEHKNGLVLKSTFYDLKNKVVKSAEAGSGVAITRWERDEAGNIIRKSFFDENDQPTNDHAGIHTVSFSYSPLRMILTEEYFDKDDKPILDKKYVHRYVFIRDEKGREIERSYFDNNGKPTKDKDDEVYAVKYKYSDSGLLLEQSYWANDSTRMGRWDGYEVWAHKFNELGQETENACYDGQGKLFVGKSGYSRTIKKYNPRAQICEYGRFCGDSAVTISNGTIKNYHSLKLSYDEKNRISGIEYFDDKDKPTEAYVVIGDGFSCHKVEIAYTGNKVVKEKIYPLNSSFPSKTIDCLKSDYVDVLGMQVGTKNR